MTEFSLQALHDEIESDPQELGYKTNGDWKGDQVIADLINAKNYVIDRISVPMESIRAEVTLAAYDTLLADRQEWLRWMTPNSGNFQVTADMKLQLSGRLLTVDGVAGTGDNGDSVWASAHEDAMAPAMLALIEIPGSRAGVLWGENITITAGNVGWAATL